MKIIRGKVNSNSADDKYHRVKVTSEGVLKNVLVDNVNGLYFRSGDEAYIILKDDYTEPLVVGRCSGQLELQDLVDIINGIISTYNNHTHKEDAMSKFFTSIPTTISVLGGIGCADLVAAISAFQALHNTSSPSKTEDSIKVDDILY